MQVCFDRGIHLPGPSVWLDPHHAKPVAVVSHAHADHVQAHGRIIATPATTAMMRLRGVVRARYEPLPFGKTIAWPGPPTGGLEQGRLTFYPAGHILGSAQVLVEWEGCRLLYSGDFKLRPGLSAEPAEVPQADTVIMETTFGKPHYRFPETAEVVEAIKVFCREALAEGCTPVLLCYSLGKGQEVLAALAGAEFPIYLQQKHWEMASLYRDFGVKFPQFQRYQPGQKLDGALLCASGCRKAHWFSGLTRTRTAYISGWAIDSGARWRFGTDAAFALSDHADYDDLLGYVRRTGATRVYTVHGFADEFAGDLRRRGIWAEPLREADTQLALF